MSSTRKPRWLRIFAVVLIIVGIPIVPVVVWRMFGKPSDALASYRKAREFMEALRAKDGPRICGLRSERERPRCNDLIQSWFEWGELSDVESYSFRSIRFQDVYPDPYYRVRFAVSPPWLGKPYGITLVIVKERGQLVIGNFYPPQI